MNLLLRWAVVGGLFGLLILGNVPSKGAEPAATPDKKPEAKDGCKFVAKVEGYTQPTQFNPQKYPFNYTGSAALKTEQLADLAKEGEVPAETAKALLGCLLWPKEGDTLEKAVLKSDGKKLTGEAQILHKYNNAHGQGTHTLCVKLEGTQEDGRWTLRVVNTKVSGTWDWGGGTMDLRGEAKITIDSQK